MLYLKSDPDLAVSKILLRQHWDCVAVLLYFDSFFSDFVVLAPFLVEG